MDTIELDTAILEPVIRFALTICFAVTCAIAIVATSGVLGS